MACTGPDRMDLGGGVGVREAQRLSGLWSYLTSIVLALVMVVC